MHASARRPVGPPGHVALAHWAHRHPADRLSTGAHRRHGPARPRAARGLDAGQSRNRAHGHAREPHGSADRWHAVGNCPYVGCPVRPSFRWFFLFLLRFSDPGSGLALVHAPRVRFLPGSLLHRLGEACPALLLARWRVEKAGKRGRPSTYPSLLPL
jgi:hypothetical protein